MALIILSGLPAGCAQTRLSHEPGLVAAWNRQPVAPAESFPVRLPVVLHTRYLEFDQPAEPSVEKWWSKHKVRHQLKDVMGEFPFLLAGEPDESASDRIVIEATYAIRGRKLLNTISQSTYYLIPSASRGVIELDAVVHRAGHPPASYEAVGTYTIKRHALLLALPFLWGYKVPANTMEDTFRDLFLQIQRDLLPP